MPKIPVRRRAPQFRSYSPPGCEPKGVLTAKSRLCPLASPVRRVEGDVLGDFPLPAIAVREKSILVVEELLARLDRELEVRTLDDGVDRACLLTEAAIDALDHVDVVARGAARAVVAARAGLDGDRLRRADRLAQLAGDAALFAIGIAAQRMLAPEAWRDRVLLEGVVDRRLRLEEITHRQEERRDELPQQKKPGRLI